jgi:glycerol kinase
MVLPALGGLGAPWYRPEARATIAGLTAAAGRPHVVRATLDGIAHRVADVVEAIAAGMDGAPRSIRVDGGLTPNGYLMERQADLLGMPVAIARIGETTALGVAGLAAVGAGISTLDDVRAANPIERTVEPRLADGDRADQRLAWRRFVERASAPVASD